MDLRWLVLCLGLTSTALAESGVAPIAVSVPTEIPSDGVLPIFGNCLDARCSNLQAIVVTDTSNGARVEGHVELVQTASYQGWGYFVPSVPFRSGAVYRAMFTGGYPGPASTVTVSAAEPTGLGENALRVTSALSKVREVTGQHCCSAANCIDVSAVTKVELTATLLPERPIATQYLFELSMHAEGETAASPVIAFRPLHTYMSVSAPAVTFDGASKSYCYTIRARPIVGGEPFKLITRCMPNDYTGLGQQTRSPEEVAQWAAKCEATTPAPGDAGAPDAGLGDAGAPTVVLADAATDADGEPLGPEKDTNVRGDESGCRLAQTGPQAGSMAWWPFALGALALANRRRATRVAPTDSSTQPVDAR